MVAELSRHLRDDEIGFVGVGTSGRAFSLVVGIPLAAGRLAQLTTAPRFDLQIGPIIGPEMQELPAPLERLDRLFLGGVWPDRRCRQPRHLRQGRRRCRFRLRRADRQHRQSQRHLDRPRGRQPRIRLIGCLALPEHQACAGMAVILADLEPRRSSSERSTTSAASAGSMAAIAGGGRSDRRRTAAGRHGPRHRSISRRCQSRRMRTSPCIPASPSRRWSRDGIPAGVPGDIPVTAAPSVEAGASAPGGNRSAASAARARAGVGSTKGAS